VAWIAGEPFVIVRRMKITPEEVRRVAVLAHLEMDSGTEERLRESLDQILGYMEQLEGVDTSSVEPALGVTEEGDALRADREVSGVSTDEALRNAPEAGDGHFKVPRVMPG